jgi:hypothetical protein
LKEAIAPPTRLELGGAESETKAGASLGNVADQLSGIPPVFAILIGDEMVPGTLIAIAAGEVTSDGGAATV